MLVACIRGPCLYLCLYLYLYLDLEHWAKGGEETRRVQWRMRGGACASNQSYSRRTRLIAPPIPLRELHN